MIGFFLSIVSYSQTMKVSGDKQVVADEELKFETRRGNTLYTAASGVKVSKEFLRQRKVFLETYVSNTDDKERKQRALNEIAIIEDKLNMSDVKPAKK